MSLDQDGRNCQVSNIVSFITTIDAYILYISHHITLTIYKVSIYENIRICRMPKTDT